MTYEIFGDRDSVEYREKWATKNIWEKHQACKTRLSLFSYEVYSYCSQRIATITFNSAQGPTQSLKLYAYKVEMLQAL